MNYRHLFHAGNFADVFKHAALVLLLRALHKKETAFCYLDTHAGTGRYDFTASEVERSPEYRDGIAKLWETASHDNALADYLSVIRTFNTDGGLRFYPGSPRIARALMRPQDRMVLCEKHPEDYSRLRAEFAGDAQVAVHERDGFEAVKALLPPRERRGLVLIDPPYEQPEEFDRAIVALEQAHTRWPTGMYALWHPIKQRATATPFYDRLKKSSWRKILAAEFMVFADDTTYRLNGCGLIFINPPWGFDESLHVLMPALQRLLSRDGAGQATVDWLVRESD